MYLKKRFIIAVFITILSINVTYSQKIDTTSKYIIIRVVESDFMGLKTGIYIYQGDNYVEFEANNKKAKKEIFKTAAIKIKEILLSGYKIISDTSGAASIDTLNSYLITTYIFEKL